MDWGLSVNDCKKLSFDSDRKLMKDFNDLNKAEFMQKHSDIFEMDYDATKAALSYMNLTSDARYHQLCWRDYVEYLKNWIKEHTEVSYYGMSPVSYSEWLDNEAEEES